MTTKRLRIVGNVGLVVGQIVLLFLSREVGLCILLACSLLSLPYFVRNKYHDIVLLILVNMGINLAGLIYPTIVQWIKP